jgi:hypothetical protein
MSTGGLAPRNPLAAKAPRRRRHREVKKSAKLSIINCSVVIQRMTTAEIEAAIYAGVKKVVTARMGTGGVAPRHWIFSKGKKNSK